ncbi:MAG: acyltransferase [Flavobacteriales bacterium]|nr:acyltransferase [Flavobacteriales bacterium]
MVTAPMHWQLVDVLRGIAVLLVLFRHHPYGGVLGHVGWLGVDLFFVLSGFLVSGLIFDEERATGRFKALRFLVRRAFKIQPSFLVLIGVTTLAMWASGRQDPPLNYVAELLFFQNYHEGLWSHTWSLAVEEHFYLILVGLAAILGSLRFTWSRFVVLCSGGMILITLLRAHQLLTGPFSTLEHFYPSHLRMDSLLAGVLLAGWHRYRSTSFHAFFRTRRWMLLGSMVPLLAPTTLLPFGSFWMYTIGLSTAYIAGMIAVGLAVTAEGHPARWRPITTPLAWVGGISYNTYLWHLFVLLVIEMVADGAGMSGGSLELVLFIIAALITGWVTTRLIERPALRLRNRIAPAWQRSTRA